MSDGPVEMPLSESPDRAADETRPGKFYSRSDLLAGAIAWLVAFVGYWWTLAPSVTFEDSGEFLTAAYQFGVPHPPGYPVWTIAASIWCRLIPFGSIAWRINFMSAVACSLTCGLAAILVSRSGRAMCARVDFLRNNPTNGSLDLIITAGAITSGLVLAFSPVMWSQAVIAGAYGPDALWLITALLVLYRWSVAPEKLWRLYTAAFLWGVGLTAHQTLVLMTLAFSTFIWFNDRKLGRDVLMPILVVIMGAILWAFVTPGSIFYEGGFSGTVLILLAVGTGFWLFKLWKQGPTLMGRWPQVLAIYGAVLLGLALYGYLFVSSCTNPPMNWGFCSQWEGFKHHFTGGQMEKVHTERTFLQLWGQFNMFFDDLQAQFNIVYALLALLGLFFFRDLDDRDRRWMKFLFVAFLCLGLGFLFLSNPSYDKQKHVADRISFLPCHCLYALWIGYGLMLGVGYLFTEKPQLRGAAMPIAIAVLLLPGASLWRNWASQEQRGHDFGYRFGYRMFKPGGGYPDMDRNAILFGGTDPGRFIPTYMIFVESLASPGSKSRVDSCPESATFDRRDVYLITQNALADNAYLNYIRDQYDSRRPRHDDPSTLTNRSSLYRTLFGMFGRDKIYPAEPIWIPSVQDAENIVGRYVEESKNRPALPGEEVKVENGHIRVTGVVGIMAINGMLTKEIFDHNKDFHGFYVEESEVIPWMYPYLEPYGLIFKLNKEPLPEISPEIVARDTVYWQGLVDELERDPKFQRDDVAQKTFSNLRAAIGGLYANRRLPQVAEGAFTQAIQICPDCPGGNFRLAQFYVDQQKYEEAVRILDLYKKRDPYNIAIPQAVEQIKRLRAEIEAIAELQKQLSASPGAVDQVLTTFAQRYPQSPVGWYNLAAILSERGDCVGGLAALSRALVMDGPNQPLHKLALRDRRLANCTNLPEFQRMVTGQPAAKPADTGTGLPFTIGK